jgi:hypothetical protein
MAELVSTYSIAACDLEAGQWGVATQSKFLAVGSVVPWAEPRVGAIATQAYANPRYGPDGLALLREDLSAEQVVERLTSADEGRDQRQLGIVDGELSPRDPKTLPSWNPSAELLRQKIGPGEVSLALAWDDLTQEQKDFQATKMAIHAAMGTGRCSHSVAAT